MSLPWQPDAHVLSSGASLVSADRGRPSNSPAIVAVYLFLGATPRGYTSNPWGAERPYFTGLSRGYFNVAEREGFASLLPDAAACLCVDRACYTDKVDRRGFFSVDRLGRSAVTLRTVARHRQAELMDFDFL
jgi:hypothetical protein